MAQEILLDREGEQDGERRHVALDPECEEEEKGLPRQEPSQRLSGLTAEWRGETIEIRFAPGGDNVLTQPARPEIRPRVRPKARVDWYEWGVILLMVSSAVAAAIGLIGAQI